MNIAVFPERPELQDSAAELAKRLSLPLILTLDESYDYRLIVSPHYLGLQKSHDVSPPLYVDFLHGKVNYRAQQASIKKEAIARAMGLKARTHPKIVDATGGLAADSFTLASLGFEVICVERSPILFALVQDAILRAKKDPRMASIISRMQFVHADATTWLQGLAEDARPDIIYLDPMFPPRKKSALPKKKMLILHDIVGEDTDALSLFETSLACAMKRVVVKRPRLAERLALNPAPSFSLLGSSSRFDVYLR